MSENTWGKSQTCCIKSSLNRSFRNQIFSDGWQAFVTNMREGNILIPHYEDSNLRLLDRFRCRIIDQLSYSRQFSFINLD